MQRIKAAFFAVLIMSGLAGVRRSHTRPSVLYCAMVRALSLRSSYPAEIPGKT
jgi:hypothetical protein